MTREHCKGIAKLRSTLLVFSGARFKALTSFSMEGDVSSIADTRNWNQEISSKRRISKKTRDNQGSRNHRKPIFLDASKRKAFLSNFREFPRST